jgi:hypothetical protein
MGLYEPREYVQYWAKVGHVSGTIWTNAMNSNGPNRPQLTVYGPIRWRTAGPIEGPNTTMPDMSSSF